MVFQDICCNEEDRGCFVKYCDDNLKVDSVIAALGIVENDALPKVGDSVTYIKEGAAVTEVITEANMASLILEWLRAKQKECGGKGKHYHFLPVGFINTGSRAEPADVTDETGSPYINNAPLYYDATSEFVVGEHYLPNSKMFCAIKKRRSSISLIYFLKQGAMLLSSNNDFHIKITAATFAITGNSAEHISGKIAFSERGKCDPEMYWADNADEYIADLKETTKYEFGDYTVTGLAPVACSGECKKYTIEADTAFTMTPDVDVLACVDFDLYKDCNTAIPVDVDMLVNTSSGEIASAGLDVGTYKFTQVVSNECCIKGSACFIINVTPAA